MATDIATTEPSIIYAGFTLQWEKTLSDYPASEYTLKYSLRGPQEIDITAEADGDDHLVDIAAADTEIWQEGDYWWYSWVEKGTGDDLEKYLIDSGRLTIKKDPEAVEADEEQKSDTEIIYRALLANYKNKANKNQIGLIAKTFSDKAFQWDKDTLLQHLKIWEAKYQTELNNYAAEKGNYAGSKIRVRFRAAE